MTIDSAEQEKPYFREAQTWVIEYAQKELKVNDEDLADPEISHAVAIGAIGLARYLDKELKEFDDFLEARGVNSSARTELDSNRTEE